MSLHTTGRFANDYDTGESADMTYDYLMNNTNSFSACFCCNPFQEILPENAMNIRGQAFDAMVVVSRPTRRIASSDFLLSFDHPTSPFPPVPHNTNITSTTTSTSTPNSSTKSLRLSHHNNSSNHTNNNNNIITGSLPLKESYQDYECEALLEVVHPQRGGGNVYFPITHDPVQKRNRIGGHNACPNCNSMDERRNSINQHNQHHNHSSPLHLPLHHHNDTTTNNRNQQQQQQDAHEQASLQDLLQLLKPGKNEIRYLFRTKQRVLGSASASIYLWEANDRIVVCDVDGTLTKSNVTGMYHTLLRENYHVHCHDQVCHFMTSLISNPNNHKESTPTTTSETERATTTKDNSHDDDPNLVTNGGGGGGGGKIRILYLSSRPIFIADKTRKFLTHVTQPSAAQQPQSQSSKTQPTNNNINNNNSSHELWKQPQASSQELELASSRSLTSSSSSCHRLPEGPLMGFSGRLLDVMKMELVSYTVHLFKASLLMEQIVKPFSYVISLPRKKLFVGAFGNTLMDVAAYHMAGMELSQIYFIDKKSRIFCLDKNRSAIMLQQPKQQPSKSTPPSNNNNLGDQEEHELLPINGHIPYLKTPLTTKECQQLMGTVFYGYHDPGLLPHVLAASSTKQS